MSNSIFSTPFITPICRAIANVCMKLAGWRIDTIDPMSKPPAILISAPHTSNWDFALMISTALHLRIEMRWMGKHTLFKQPFSGLMHWMGGIPINRNSASNAVKQTIEKFEHDPELIVVIPPEGTRKKVNEWKTGFYHIACGAKVPIIMVAIDGKNKSMRFLGEFTPTGDISADLPLIQHYFDDIVGVIAGNT